MTLSTETKTQIEHNLSRWNEDAILERVEEITPDASLRRYYRAFYREGLGGEGCSVVVMIFDSVAPAEADGPEAVDSDLAYVELAEFLQNAGVRVPRVLYSSQIDHTYLLEDLGSKVLADLALDWHSPLVAVSEPRHEQKRERLVSLYQQAIDQIAHFQLVGKTSASSNVFNFALQRRFSSRLFVREMSEMLDFALVDERGSLLDSETRSELEEAMQSFAEHLSRFPYVFTHRDFHSWNLHVDPQGQIRVIDFQDALMGPECYDLISLLQDRDTDALLGVEIMSELIAYAQESLNIGSHFHEEYACLSLQRDLKVAGRFSKIAKVRGATNYLRWVPGTQKRIGRSLAFLLKLQPKNEAWLAMSRILGERIDDVQRGLVSPLF